MENKLRIKIYERLGLELGSLSSESGNDWVRAEKEILEEEKEEEKENQKQLQSINYLTISKNSSEFNLVINSVSFILQNYRVEITKRNDLEDSDITKLLNDTNKDILIGLSKYQKLAPEHIDIIIPHSVYLVKKNLLENQLLSLEQKNKLLRMMQNSNLNHSTLVDEYYKD